MITYTPKIFDTTFFWKELDILEARLEYLYPYVHKFVIVESKTEHNGNIKEFNIENNKARFSKYWDKIIYIKDTDDLKIQNTGWNIENYHRNSITKGLTEALPEDIIMISDLDEIWHPQYIDFIKSDKLKHGEAFSCLQMHYTYFSNILSLNPSVGSVILKKSTLDLVSPQYMRNQKDKLPRLNFAGFHLSYFNGINTIYEKFLTSCDVHDKNEIPSKEEICLRLKRRLKEGQFNIRHDINHPIFFVKEPYLPSSITKQKYPQFFIDSIDDIKIF